MNHKTLQQIVLFILSIVFSIALMFSFTELPRLLDTALGQFIDFPGLDHGASEISSYKADIYMSSLHLRWIGYLCLLLVMIFIILGFTTKKTAWAWAGAFTIFLPVFGQFAMSMFFLAGLGMLRVGWMPFWDISFQVLDLGNVIYVPYWILMWIFRQFDYWAQYELAWFFMGSGAFLFTWGVLVWMQSRFGRSGVAISWIYKISRHPQYLGWIIWTYGLIIYAPMVNDLKKSWGMASSLPWLLMTMIIIGICMLEELNMSKKYGADYDEYRDKTPFLFPLPAWLKKGIKFPMWLLIRKQRPEKKREVALVISVYTIILIAISLIWVDFGDKNIYPISTERRQAIVNELVEDINGELVRRERWSRFNELAEYGDLAIQPMIELLYSDNPENQEFAAEKIGKLGDTSAAKYLYKLLDHPWENVRVHAVKSLAELGDKKIIPRLIIMLNKESGDYPRSVIYESLGKLEAEEAWDVLVDGSINNTESVRMTAVWAMIKLRPQESVSYIIPLLQSESEWVRGNAAAAANMVPDKRLLPYLEVLVDDKDIEIRFLAKEAIQKIQQGQK